jgi:hypothetical protein
LTDIPLKCTCGAFRAVVHRAGDGLGNHCVCYCADCQNFARYLGRHDEILNPNGGTEIYQVPPGRIEILQGREHLRCVHLTDKPTLRWYLDCCKSPLGNTLNSIKVPFIGLIHSAIDSSEVEGGLDALIGPVRAHVNGKGAVGDTSGLRLYDSAPLSLYVRFAWMVFRARLTGEYRRSPLFDRETGRPIVKPIRHRQ